MLPMSLEGIVHGLTVVLGIGFLIFIHELGHFLVAKRMGVRVERFSLGFGPVIIGRKYGDTEYVLSWIPLGGYVKMAGENVGDPTHGAPDEFPSKPIWQRAAIAVAGIAMNSVTAVAAFMIAFGLGIDAIAPVVGATEAGRPAWRAGIQEGDRILSVGGTPVHSFEDIIQEVALQDGPVVPIAVERPGAGEPRRLEFQVHRETGLDLQIPQIGIMPAPSLRLAGIHSYAMGGAKSPAEASGFREGDLILDVDGQPVATWREFERALGIGAGRTLQVGIRRDDEDLRLPLTPQPRLTLGVEPRMRVVVQACHEGSPAALSGLASGDRVLSIDGQAIETAEAFQRAVQSGELHPLSFLVQRADGTTATFQVEPEERGPDRKRILGLQFAPEPSHAVLADPPLGSPAHAAGLRGGDVVLGLDAADGPTRQISRWSQLEEAIQGLKPAAKLSIRYQRRGALADAAFEMPAATVATGLEPAIVIGAVQPDSPAAAAGLAPGDRLRYLRLANPPAGKQGLADSQATWGGMQELVSLSGKLGGDAPLPLLLDWVHEGPEGPEEHLQTSLLPVRMDPQLLRAVGFSAAESAGMLPRNQPVLLRMSGFAETFGAGLRRTRDEVRNIGRTVARFFAPQGQSISPKNLGGFITIFMGADHSLESGPGTFVLFLGIISVNLAVLNLLPIPILDGGLLLLLLLEKLKGSPLAERTVAILQYAGLALILPLILFVTYNDISRAVSRWL